MSKQSAENYLDELLNSINGDDKYKDVQRTEEIIGELPEEVITEAEDVQSASPFDVKMSAKAEAEFLMEFEKELAGEDFDDFLKEFEESEIQPEDRLEASDVEMTEEDALLSMLGGDTYMQEEVEIPDEIQDEIPEEMSLAELALDALDSMEEPEHNVEYDVAPADAIDLSQMGEEDLINLLAGAGDLADIGELLSKNDNDTPVESEDAFASFAEKEMAAGQEEATVEEVEDEQGNKKKNKKSKKGNFLEKMKKLLFGEDEDDETQAKATKTSSIESIDSLSSIESIETIDSIDALSLFSDGTPGVEILSDENAQILAAFAEADKNNSMDEIEPENKKKGKKDKKKKEPKVKKPKKPKAPKKKKEKKPKVVDNTPPLPKGPVALVCLLAISILVLVYFGSGLIGYSTAVSKANDMYKMGQYAEAAAELSGHTIQEKDSMLYGKITVLAAVDSEITSYQIFFKNERKAEALDALVSAAGRCELNEEGSLIFDCAGEMGILKDYISVELEEQFSLSYDEAVELYNLTERDRDEYTIALDKVLKELGIK